MAKFIFKLQGILNIKEKLEEQEKIAYGNARIRLTEEEEKLDALFGRRVELVEEKRIQMSAVISARELNLTENAIRATDLAIEDQKISVKKAQRALENARIKLEEAMKERKIYEKLRENAFTEFLAETEHAEQMEINELVSYRHGRANA
ncbi:MAG: flagellar export protein FliJ [Lachnospiraceae bacterium]|nr:flagellar export protein FliJ [Lachnospiraceae bacterium]